MLPWTYRGAVEFAVLGHLQVTGDSGVVEIPSAKERLLLALLVSRAGTTMGTQELVDGLWGQQAPRSAVKSLQTYVLRLRRTLEPERVGTPRLLVTDGHGYRLAVSPRDVDAERFVQLLAAADHGHPRERLDLLCESLRLWRGPAYAGLADGPRLGAEAARLDALRLAALEERYAVELELGGSSSVVAELERMVVDHPLRERLWALLVTGLYRAGRQAEALGAYERARALLAEELGIDPGPELRELHERVLAQDRSLDADLPRASLPAPLLAAARVLHGRERELATLRQEWRASQAGEARVVVVRGPVGSGGRSVAAVLAEEVAASGGIVHYVGALGAEAVSPPHRPALLVADRVPSPHANAAMTVRIDGPGAEAAGATAVVDLTPLDRDAIRALVSRYVAPAELESVTDLVLAESGGWPGRAHAAALGHVRRQATVVVRAAAAATDRSHSSLLEARSRLVDGVLDLGILSSEHASDASRCPWPGLAAYEVADGAWFAGRERLVAEMVARVAGVSCLAVIGASGSGKSSAVRAGLLAGLADDRLPGSAGWELLTMRPGTHPLRELAHVVLGARSVSAGAVLERLVRSPESAEARTVLVVDQFEEVWTACDDEGERGAFLDMLADLVSGRSPQVTVVIVLRADFLDRLADHAALAAAAADNTVLVGAPTRDDVRRAVERPAHRMGLAYDEGLVDALVADAGTEPGLLPLLSTALAQLWSARDGRRLTFAAYVGFGGLSGAITHLAEQVWLRLDDPGRGVARAVLLRLTGSAEGGLVVRRRVPMTELAGLPHSPLVGPVVEQLVDARLLSRSTGHVEVAHEALFAEWPRLRDWLAEDAAGRTVQRHLAGAAAEWHAEGREPSLLWRGSRLEAGLEVAAARPEELTSTERAFLRAGRDAVEAARRDAERRADAEARLNRRLRVLLAGAAVLLILTLVAGALALAARDRAGAEARAAAASAVAADARRLAASALSVEHPDLALLTAVESVRREKNPETHGALLTLLSRQPDVVTRFRSTGRLWRTAASPDGSIVFVSENGPVLRALDAESGEQRWSRQMLGRVGQIAPSPDGRAVAVTVGAPKEVLVMALNPASGEELWRIGTGDARRLEPRTAQFFWEDLGWTADGRLGFANDSHVFFASTSGRVSASVGWPGALLDTLTFEVWPDGRVSTGPSEVARGLVVDPSGRASPRTTRGAVMAVSPDGSRVVEIRQGEGDGATVRLLHAGTLQPRSAAWPLDGRVSRVAFAPDGERFSIGVDEQVHVRDGRTAGPVLTLAGHSGTVSALTYAGRAHDLIWTAGLDGTAVAFDAAGSRGVIGTFKTADAPHSGEVAARSASAIWTDWSDRRPNVAFLRRQGDERGRRLPLSGLGSCDCNATATELTRDGRVALVGMQVMEGLEPALDRGYVVVYDAARRRVRAVVDTPWPVYGIAVTPDGSQAVVNGAEGWGFLELATMSLSVVDSVPAGFVRDGLSTVEVTEDGTRAVLLRSPAVVVVDVASHAVLVRRDLHVTDDQLPSSADWSRDGDSLAVGTLEGSLVVLDGATLDDVAPRRQITGGYVSDVEVAPDGRTAATMGSEGDVTLWDVDTWRPFGQPLPEQRGPGFLAYDQDSTVLRVRYEDRTMTRVGVRPAAWVRAACEAANRDLTAEESAVIRPGLDPRPTCS